jgi:biopolymer transport protein ExbB/TolQ
MPLDTLQAAKRLQEDDTFSPEQAERIAEILSDMDVASATAEDLQEMETRLSQRLDRAGDERSTLKEQLTDRFEARIAQLERRLLVAGVPTIAAIVAILNYLMG